MTNITLSITINTGLERERIVRENEVESKGENITAIIPGSAKLTKAYKGMTFLVRP